MSFRQLHFKAWAYFFLGQKLNRFQPYHFLFWDISQKTHVTWELTTESASHSNYLAARPWSYLPTHSTPWYRPIRERYEVCMRRDSAHYGSTAVLLLLPQRRPSGVRRTSKNKHDTKTCCPCLPCDEEGGLCRTAAICPGWNSACDRSSCPCREAGREEESSGCGQARTSIPGGQVTQDRGNETA